jgi:hypothetical protein
VSKPGRLQAASDVLRPISARPEALLRSSEAA